MGVKLAPMNVTLLKEKKHLISWICAAMLFIAVLPLPIGYYTLLRIVVFIGALFVISENFNSVPWILIFALIAILFNPLFPVYLGNKSTWIPIDLICGVLFLLSTRLKRSSDSDNDLKDQNNNKRSNTFQRDKIH